MRILMICGVFDDCHNNEIISKTKTYVEYAANNFQKKIIKGIQQSKIQLDVISAPFLGAYPNAYSDFTFKGFKSDVIDESGYKYVNFLNLWGLRNLSRAHAIKKSMSEFIDSADSEKYIIVYTPHTPFIQAANYAKHKDPRIKICLVVPDLPQYMNLADKVSPIYKFLKKYDVKAFMRENRTVDSYVILTKYMVEPLDIKSKPYIVIEGIYQDTGLKKETENSDIKKIVYTGKLDRSFGIMNLVNAFMRIKDKKIELIICGNGEEKKQVQKAAETDTRIHYMGQVSSDVAIRLIYDGDILVNPRANNSDYTKYSFPSKIIDYLATGNPVIAYKLDGMPDIYSNFITFVQGDTVDDLQHCLESVIYSNSDELKKKTMLAKKYLNDELSSIQVAKRIIALLNK